MRTHYSKDIGKKDAGKPVELAGWVRKVRDLGNVKFLVLYDRYGEIQVTVKDATLGKLVNSITRESAVRIKGKVEQSDKTSNGIEIIPEDIIVVAKAETPLPMETDSNIKSELDTRIENRFIDLRRREAAAVFEIKSVIYKSFLDYFEKQGFKFMHTPCIIAAATEGGTNLFPISYFEREAFLVQSPQLYKQILMGSTFDKVCIISPAFRAEEHNTVRHLNEVIQMDIETAFVENEEDALKYAEGMVNYVYSQVAEKCKEHLKVLGRELKVPELPFKRISYDEVLELLEKDGIKIEWGDDLNGDAERALCKHFDPVIVTKWPTKVRAFYSMPEPGNEKICRSYDVLIHGMEAMSGAQRIHELPVLEKALKDNGLDPAGFKFYLDAFKYGMPPHAGWSFGLERLTMLICGLKNIREATLWPRDRTRLTP